MGLDVKFKPELANELTGALVFLVRCAKVQGNADPAFIAGALAMAEHRALAMGLDWPGILQSTRDSLGRDVAGLIDAALALESGMVVRARHS